MPWITFVQTHDALTSFYKKMAEIRQKPSLILFTEVAVGVVGKCLIKIFISNGNVF